MTPTISYERVTYRPEGGRIRSVYLQNVVVTGDLLTGVEVNREGDEIASRGADERRHVISIELVKERTPMRMDRFYGELVRADRPAECVCGCGEGGGPGCHCSACQS